MHRAPTCQPLLTFFHLKLSAYPAARNLRVLEEMEPLAKDINFVHNEAETHCPSTLEEKRVSEALIGTVSPSKRIVG